MLARFASFNRSSQTNGAPNKSDFSVSVVLPASGWEIIANVRRLSTSSQFIYLLCHFTYPFVTKVMYIIVPIYTQIIPMRHAHEDDFNT